MSISVLQKWDYTKHRVLQLTFFHPAISCQCAHRCVSFLFAFALPFAENARFGQDMALSLSQQSPYLHFQLLAFPQTKFQPKLNFSLVSVICPLFSSLYYSHTLPYPSINRETPCPPAPHFSPERHTSQPQIQANLILNPASGTSLLYDLGNLPNLSHLKTVPHLKN